MADFTTEDGRFGFQPSDFTVEDVLAWARTKPSSGAYCYTDPGNCAVAQFLSDTDRTHDPQVIPGYWSEAFGVWPHRKFPAGLEEAVAAKGRTFGALVTRLEKLVQETPVTKSPWLSPAAYADVEGVSA